MIQTSGLSKSFQDLNVLKGIDLRIAAQEIVVLLGPSGSGKSTLLRCLNGLEELSGGSLEVNGIRVDADMPASRKRASFRDIRRDTGMVFQQFNLYPHKTVLGNVIESLLIVKNCREPKRRASACGCWNASAWRISGISIRPGCPAASNSASPSRARWRRSRP